MNKAKPLPRYLVQRFQGWKETEYKDNQAWYRKLADGQHPRAMVISCCDSRVHVTSIFGADQGEFFIHRNIANLVPPYKPSGDFHGTSAAVEYAVKALKVAHILVMGHSGCGGVQGCIDMCSNDKSPLHDDFPFVAKWLQILKPRYKSVADITDVDARQRAFEHQAVLTSLQNLMSFPAISERVNKEELSLHGLWHDIGEGEIQVYNSEIDRFEAL
ncbi:carbonic anhydrase [Ruegeria lacuscaerulensis]|uniref:carbonic anhydrase n=1 Tax=Ruegeria lacuscaerulensis TaxID=55218 RepID=UPI001479E783|nr:carbonic anhydrase [Ruegeria lacuscaerulensis]